MIKFIYKQYAKDKKLSPIVIICYLGRSSYYSAVRSIKGDQT